MNDFIRTFLRKWVGKAKLWGESAVPDLPSKNSTS
jgi:hypothetical protein